MMNLIFGLSLLSQLLLQTNSSPLYPRDASTPDPFYDPPSNFQDQPLGTILKSRETKASWWGGILSKVEAKGYQLLYRTESQNGTALAAMTTILLPDKFSNDPPNIISYHPAEDSTASKCAASRTYLTGFTLNSIEFPIIQALLLQGWMVVMPDYEGPNGAYVIGRLEGKLVLDSLRATLKHSPLGLTNSSKIGLAGYSGGSSPTAWGAALHPTYAPELNIVGAAYGGTIADLSLSLKSIDGTAFSGFVFAGVSAAVNTYSTLGDFLTKYGTEAHQAFIKFCNENCMVSILLKYPFHKYQTSTYTSFGSDVLSQPPVEAVLKENSLGLVKSEIPTVPQYIHHAHLDEIVTVKGIENTVQTYCDNGIESLIYDRNIGLAEHATQAVIGLPRVFKFFIDRFNGVEPQKGCLIRSTTTVDMLTHPGSSGTALHDIWNDIAYFLTHKPY